MHTLTLVGTEAVPLRVNADVRVATRSRFEFAGNVGSDLKSQFVTKIRALLRPDRMVTRGVTHAPWWASDVALSFEPSTLPVGSECEAAVLASIFAAMYYGGVKDTDSPVADYAQAMYWVGEFGLDGQALPLQNALAYALRARQDGRELVIPSASAREIAALGRPAYAVPDLLGFQRLLGLPLSAVATQAWPHVLVTPGPDARAEFREDPGPPQTRAPGPDCAYDFGAIKGQAEAKRAAEIAAAGGHNMLLLGPPGEGKSLLAKALPGIMPPLTGLQAVEVTHVHRMKGLVNADDGLLAVPPFIQIDRNSTLPALLGSGSTVVKPGALTLAHHGILYLDELHQATTSMIEALRQPLEDGYVVVQRARWSAQLPARFIFVTSSNPCRCGWLGHPKHPCRCSAADLVRYQTRLSGPLLDRIPLTVMAQALTTEEYRESEARETSAQVRARVIAARARMASRGWDWNALIPPEKLRDAADLTPGAEAKEVKVADRHGLSTRARDHLLRVARTVADLRGSTQTEADDLEVAALYCDRDALFRHQ